MAVDEILMSLISFQGQIVTLNIRYSEIISCSLVEILLIIAYLSYCDLFLFFLFFLHNFFLEATRLGLNRIFVQRCLLVRE